MVTHFLLVFVLICVKICFCVNLKLEKSENKLFSFSIRSRLFEITNLCMFRSTENVRFLIRNLFRDQVSIDLKQAISVPGISFNLSVPITKVCSV